MSECLHIQRPNKNMGTFKRNTFIVSIAALWLLLVNILFFALRIGHSSLFHTLLRKFHS